MIMLNYITVRRERAQYLLKKCRDLDLVMQT